ncbi:MAG: CDP-alcohol phosphatidyltransferase family protein [Candidatus Poribacteria bacterium]|nr:CDP-alcohol phosphatidyltransferase family protein [Candidatus Poribacteria bacterium]
MFANTITLSRLLLTFGVIMLFGMHRNLGIALVATIALIFTLAAVDGIVARKRRETSEIGRLLDIFADRVIENTFWVYFAAIGLLPLWIPIIVVARYFLTDGFRRYITPETESCASILTNSRTIRGIYGGIKMFTFMSLASMRVSNRFLVLEQVSMSLAVITVTFCLLRALPTFIAVHKMIGKRELDAKCFRSVSQGTERFTRKPSIPKKAVR